MQPLAVTLIQASTHWHDAAANRDMFDEYLAQVPDDTRLVILPEMFSTGFTMASGEVAEDMQGPTTSWLQSRARQMGKALCGSVVIEADGHIYNRFIFAHADGSLDIYDKRHRFRMADEHQHYAAGEARHVFVFAGWRICPMICYDLRFPVFFRNQGDYDLLLCVANWPAARQQAWNTLLRARSIENQVFVCGVNIVGEDGNGVTYTGGSAIYAPDGEIKAEVFDQPQLINQTLDAQYLVEQRASFPVWQDADKFQIDIDPSIDSEMQ